MPRKRAASATAVSESDQATSERALKLVPASYGELQIGERYSMVDDSDPYALRYRKRRSTLDVDHASSTPVFVADKWDPPVYVKATSAKRLAEIISESFGSENIPYRYDALTKQIIVGIGQPPSITIPPRSASTSNPTHEPPITLGASNATQPHGAADPNKTKNPAPIAEVPSTPSAAPKFTRIKWDDDLNKRLRSSLKLKISLEQIAFAISQYAGKTVSVDAVKAQARKNGLANLLPKKGA